MNGRTQALLFRLVPSLLLLGLVAYTVVGPGGVLDYLQARRAAEAARVQWAELERRNNLLLFEVQQLRQDPIHLERLAADELRRAREGTTLYVFNDEGAIDKTIR